MSSNSPPQKSVQSEQAVGAASRSDALSRSPPESEGGEMPDVYWGVSSGSSIKALRIASRGERVEDHGHTIDGSKFPAPTHAEISFATQNKNALWKGPEWFIDCGGFTELSRSDDGTYSSDLSTYIEYLTQHLDDGIDIKYWALRDWPITDELLREHGRTERDHQRWTIRDHWRSLELAEESGLLDRDGVDPIAVLQGEDVAGYLWMLDHLRENGLLTDHVCLGSIKKLDHHQVQDVAEAVRDALPSKYTLHGLGITKRHLQYPGIREHFDTIDTQAWNKQTNQLSADLESVKNTWVGYIWAFRKYVEKLQQQAETTSETRQGTGTKLFDFAGGQQSVSGHSDSPLNECVCGTTVDPNAILDYYDDSVNTENTDPLDALDMAGCRHCRRRILNLSMQCLDGVPDRFGPA